MPGPLFNSLLMFLQHKMPGPFHSLLLPLQHKMPGPTNFVSISFVQSPPSIPCTLTITRVILKMVTTLIPGPPLHFVACSMKHQVTKLSRLSLACTTSMFAFRSRKAWEQGYQVTKLGSLCLHNFNVRVLERWRTVNKTDGWHTAVTMVVSPCYPSLHYIILM